MPKLNPYTIAGLACLTLLFLAALAGAQTKTITYEDMDQGPEGGSCMKKAIQSLYDAVDPNLAHDQDWNLNAAKAYRELAGLRVSCA